MAKVIKTESGLRICYERKKSVLSCSLGVFVNAGSRNEQKKNNGIAHFIEHMMFKGTEKRSAFDIANELDKLGANNNAYTSKSNTVYYVTGLGKFINEYMDILSDMLFNSTFTDENIAREKGVVLEEIKMYNDEGDSVCADLLSEKFFAKDALARPILGTEKTVKSFTASDIRAFMDSYYRPENMCLSYVGNMDEKTFLSLVNKYFDKPFFEKKYAEKFTKKTYRGKKTAAVYAECCDKPFEQANVMIRFPAYGIGDKRADILSTLSYMLGGGMSSRLFQKVREERGLVYEIFSSASSINGAGYFDISFACAPEQTAEAVSVIRNVLEDVKKDGFTQEEFDKVKIQRETCAVLGAESTFDEMRLMGRYYLLTGKVVTYKKLLKQLEKVTVDDVKAVFDDIIDYEKAAFCYVGKPIDTDLFRLFKQGVQ